MADDKEQNDAMADAIAKAIEKVFEVPDSSNKKRFVDISRVPLICQAIVAMDKRLEGIESNISKGVWIVLTAVIVALIAVVIKV